MSEFPFETISGTPRLTELANEVSAAIEAAIVDGIPMDEAVSIVASVAADHARITYGPGYLLQLAEMVRRRNEQPLPKMVTQ